MTFVVQIAKYIIRAGFRAGSISRMFGSIDLIRSEEEERSLLISQTSPSPGVLDLLSGFHVPGHSGTPPARKLIVDPAIRVRAPYSWKRVVFISLWSL